MFHQGEFFTAFLTLEVLDSLVNKHVALKRVVADKGFAAFVALELLHLLVLLLGVFF